MRAQSGSPYARGVLGSVILPTSERQRLLGGTASELATHDSRFMDSSRRIGLAHLA
jgi:hypothetical protein